MANCNCIGPQNGKPLCPCRMRYVQVIDGRYVLPAQDLGPCETTEQERKDQALKRILEYAGSLPTPLPRFDKGGE